MAAEPGIVSRVAQPYVAIRAFVIDFAAVLPAGTRRAPDGEQWGCRLETYYDEPGQDMNEWKTELAFKLAE